MLNVYLNSALTVTPWFHAWLLSAVISLATCILSCWPGSLRWLFTFGALMMQVGQWRSQANCVCLPPSSGYPVGRKQGTGSLLTCESFDYGILWDFSYVFLVTTSVNDMKTAAFIHVSYQLIREFISWTVLKLILSSPQINPRSILSASWWWATEEFLQLFHCVSSPFFLFLF